MPSSQIIEDITGVVSELLAKMSIQAKVRAKIIDRENQEVISVNIEIEASDNPNLLIGQRGANLAALQHLVRMIMRKKVQEKIDFIVDINQYKENRIMYLEKLAQNAALQVVQTKKPLVLESMQAYERRIVHLALSHHDAVVTESAGEDADRRITIKLRES